MLHMTLACGHMHVHTQERGAPPLADSSDAAVAPAASERACRARPPRVPP